MEIFRGKLRAAGLRVECHDEYLPQNASDDVWIRFLASKNWYALGNDKKIYRRRFERDMVMRAGIGYFILTGANRSGEHLADNFLRTLPKIRTFVKEHKRPFIAGIHRPYVEGRIGRVELKYPRS